MSLADGFRPGSNSICRKMLEEIWWANPEPQPEPDHYTQGFADGYLAGFVDGANTQAEIQKKEKNS